MPEWWIGNARLTFFVTPDFVESPELWRECVGDESTSSTFQRATATKIEIGAFAEARLTMLIQPMRVDWVHEPVGLAAERGLPPVLGLFPVAADPLLQLGNRWAQSGSFPDTTRIALGFNLVSLTTDRASGYRELANFIHVPANPLASDFLYQVNIPRDSRVEVAGLRVNRLMKWSVGLSRLMALTPAAPSPSQVVGPDLHHLNLELDINTLLTPEGLIPRDKVSAVINDLVDGAKEAIGGLDAR